MNQGSSFLLERLLQSENERRVIRQLVLSDDSSMPTESNKVLYDQLLARIGVTDPTPEDYKQFKDYCTQYFEYTDADAQSRSQKIGKALNAPGKTLPTWAKVTLMAASNGIRAGGNIANTRANRLAQALLQATRTSTDRQRDLYGLSNQERLAKPMAQKKIMDGETVKHLTDATANTLDAITGQMIQEDTMKRMLEAAPYLEGTPRGLYENMEQMNRANSKMLRDFKGK